MNPSINTSHLPTQQCIHILSTSASTFIHQHLFMPWTVPTFQAMLICKHHIIHLHTHTHTHMQARTHAHTHHNRHYNHHHQHPSIITLSCTHPSTEPPHGCSHHPKKIFIYKKNNPHAIKQDASNHKLMLLLAYWMVLNSVQKYEQWKVCHRLKVSCTCIERNI